MSEANKIPELKERASDNKVYNPKSKRWVDKDGDVGRSVVEAYQKALDAWKAKDKVADGKDEKDEKDHQEEQKHKTASILASFDKKRLSKVKAKSKSDKAFKDQYTDWKKLGQGAFGAAYMAHDQAAKTTVVLKQMIPSKQAKLMWEHEVKITQKLKKDCQQYLVCYVDAVQTKEHYYLIIEFLGNYKDLFSFISGEYESDGADEKKGEEKKKDRQHLSKEIVVKIIGNLLRGVHVIHRAGVAHCDLKPENVMVNPSNGDIKIIDFGVSCFAAECNTHTATGTTDYMAPELGTKLYHEMGEVKKNHKWKLRDWQSVDMWALGCTIYDLLDQTEDELLRRVFHHQYSEIEKLMTSPQGKKKKKVPKYNSDLALEYMCVFDLNDELKEGDRMLQTVITQYIKPKMDQFIPVLNYLLTFDASKRSLSKAIAEYDKIVH